MFTPKKQVVTSVKFSVNGSHYKVQFDIKTSLEGNRIALKLNIFYITFFLAFDFSRFCMVIRFVHSRHNGQ